MKSFKDIRLENKNEINKLSELASNTLINIVNNIDEYDLKGHYPRHLRHLLHKSSEMVFFSFNGQLSWQTGANISHRINRINYIEDNLTPRSKNLSLHNSREEFKDKYFKNPNSHLENELETDIGFCQMISELKLRIDPLRHSDLINSIRRTQ